MNKVILMGRTTNTPDVSYYGESGTIAKFSLAVNASDEHADFIRCTAFGKTAEVIAEHVTKGMKLLIEGRWQTGSYETEDDQGSYTVYTNECVVGRLEFCESKKNNENDTDDKPKSGKKPNNTGKSGRAARRSK